VKEVKLLPDKFECPHCGHVIEEDELANMAQFNCPKCKKKASVKTDDRDLIARKDERLLD
jgi:Zn finger protein HypA/HybF involved in hydrogenase expression